MTVLTFPAACALQLAAFTLGQQRYDYTEQSDGNGNTATRLGAPPRWRASLRSVPALLQADAARWKALQLGLRGRINHLALWDVTNPQPRGTARGTMVLASTAAAGAASISISGTTAGGTLEPGDMLQLGTGVGSHYCMLMAPATADGSGNISISIEPPTRASIASGTAVAWDKPVAHYKQVADAASWDAVPGSSDVGGFALDLIEDWRA